MSALRELPVVPKSVRIQLDHTHAIAEVVIALMEMDTPAMVNLSLNRLVLLIQPIIPAILKPSCSGIETT